MTAPPINAGLTPYTGEWGPEQAAHLLRRCTFGPNNEQIKWATDAGLVRTVDRLLQVRQLPDPPLNPEATDDPAVAIGSSWVQAPYSESGLSGQLDYRRRSLQAWTIGVMLEEDFSIREKLTLFWHNHFAINGIGDPKFLYRYIATLREHALGDFRVLTKAVTIDPAMLRFLNGNQNTQKAPNENYARELLELFTVGKGKQEDSGDYTTFTEHDVQEIARILSGWRDYGYQKTGGDGEIGALFWSTLHDTGTKQLSDRFNRVVIPNKGIEEYDHLIDIIFQRPEVALFISRKLYQWFVYYEIDELVEAEVIEPMAQILRDNDYQIKFALQALLSSEHFFDRDSIGVMIRNPMDFALTAVKSLQMPLPESLEDRYNALLTVFQMVRDMQMEYFEIPEVAGWDAYYIQPLFYRTWISTATLPIRLEVTDRLATEGYPMVGSDTARMLKIDVLALLDTLELPADPYAVVEELARVLFPYPLSEEQLQALKDHLLEGAPDYEWGKSYNAYSADPAGSGLAVTLETKLRSLVQAMLSMPEYYLG